MASEAHISSEIWPCFVGKIVGIYKRTVKPQNVWTPKKIAVITRKFKQMGSECGGIKPTKDGYEKAISEAPDQTVWESLISQAV